MTRRREIQLHLKSLKDINGIMGSMKNLSLVEIRKLERFLSAQKRVVESTKSMAADFLFFHTDYLSVPERRFHIYIVIGSERGFCGDFNESLIDTLMIEMKNNPTVQSLIVPVGRKICNKLEGNKDVAEFLPGPGVAEEVHALLIQLLKALEKLNSLYGPSFLTVLHHIDATPKAQITPVLPPFSDLNLNTMQSMSPPILNVPPGDFFSELVDHFLFAALHEIFYASLMAEHQRRVQHLGGAIKRLDDRLIELTIKRNELRQEEITEEIEVIMLSTSAIEKL